MNRYAIILAVILLAASAKGFVHPVGFATNQAPAVIKDPPDCGITLSAFTNALNQQGVAVREISTLKCHFLAGCQGYHQIYFKAATDAIEIYEFNHDGPAKRAFPGGVYTNAFAAARQIETKGTLDLVINPAHPLWKQIHEVWSRLGETPKPAAKPAAKK
jgi:hypothetical protein